MMLEERNLRFGGYSHSALRRALKNLRLSNASCAARQNQHFSGIMIPTRRHLEYAAGFIELGMLASAEAELGQITPSDQASAAVMLVRLDLLMLAKDWAAMVALARALTQQHPEQEKGWIYHAYALREQSRIAEAQAVLLHAEPQHGATSGVLHYNLACYACLLGDKSEARRRLECAALLEKSWLESAMEDPDLATLRGELRARKA